MSSESPAVDTSDAADTEAVDGSVQRPDTAATEQTEPYTGKATGEGFGSKGWIMVAAVVLCFLVIPGVIYLRPTAPAQLGLPFFTTFLVLPLSPAVGLGLLAVWSMRAAA